MMINPTQVYDQKTKTALGAQNPFYLKQAKKAQPALYDGDELLKPHHVPVIVSTSEEELELAEATRNKLHVKMNDSVCVEKRVNITPPNYSKENFMATFTPQTQLTPEQVFWSLDLAKRKAEELKANATPLPVLPPATVYPPNTPAHLVPRTLPTTSQVNIGLYVITQLFWDFEKTCKKRITPTGITEGERGFEQTKRCYLTEVIPFFNLLKEHFDGIQKSLVTEVRAMKAVFENLEAEVDQNETDLRSGEIERKNLLITNENLVAECVSKDVFYTVTDSVLNVSRFSDMHDAFTRAQKRIADLESENFNLRNKIQNDDHDSMIKHFSKLEVEHFNLQLKYQNLKERFGNKKPVTSSDAPSFDSLFALVSQNKDLTAKLNALHDLNECFRAENAKVKQHYKELYDSIKITRAKTTDQNNSLLSEIEHLKDQLKENSKCVTIPDCKPKVLAPGRYPIDVEPIPPRLKKNREVHLHYIKRLKENVETLREIVEDANVERPLDTSLASACRYTKHSQELSTALRSDGLPVDQQGNYCLVAYNLRIACTVHSLYLDFGGSKHMTGDRSGSGFRQFVIQFLEVPSQKAHMLRPRLRWCRPSQRKSCEDLGKLKAKADIGFFVGYAPNRKGYRIYNKQTRQIMETIHVTFDELTEQTAPVHSSSGPNPNLLTPGLISLGLVPNSAPAIPYVPPTNKDLELLFQPMFDEYFETPIGDHQMPHVPTAPPLVIPTGPSVSISFDNEEPSGSHSSSSSAH
ncbi:hypothetical protein Tco_0656146 [Tanacetum coccineum]|uniref:Retroviral polymerase SH3-like domain-containing protein n=1 Tax=Tanacetum coccineum TaxID=301880 RepID=A0ABQ4X975_9ASTR